MSWNSWAESVKQQRGGDAVSDALVVGMDGNPWGCSGNRALVGTEGADIAAILNNQQRREDAFQKGLYFNGEKLQVVHGEDGEVKAVKKGSADSPSQLLTVERCKTCYMMALGSGERKGDVTNCLHKTVEMLKQQGC